MASRDCRGRWLRCQYRRRPTLMTPTTAPPAADDLARPGHGLPRLGLDLPRHPGGRRERAAPAGDGRPLPAGRGPARRIPRRPARRLGASRDLAPAGLGRPGRRAAPALRQRRGRHRGADRALGPDGTADRGHPAVAHGAPRHRRRPTSGAEPGRHRHRLRRDRRAGPSRWPRRRRRDLGTAPARRRVHGLGDRVVLLLAAADAGQRLRGDHVGDDRRRRPDAARCCPAR